MFGDILDALFITLLIAMVIGAFVFITVNFGPVAYFCSVAFCVTWFIVYIVRKIG